MKDQECYQVKEGESTSKVNAGDGVPLQNRIDRVPGYNGVLVVDKCVEQSWDGNHEDLLQSEEVPVPKELKQQEQKWSAMHKSGVIISERVLSSFMKQKSPEHGRDNNLKSDRNFIRKQCKLPSERLAGRRAVWVVPLLICSVSNECKCKHSEPCSPSCHELEGVKAIMKVSSNSVDANQPDQ